MELKEFQAQKKKIAQEYALRNLKRSIRVIILLITPFLISGYFWFCFMNPIGYFQNLTSTIFGTASIIILFFIEFNIFDP